MLTLRTITSLDDISESEWDQALGADAFYTSHGWLLSREEVRKDEYGYVVARDHVSVLGGVPFSINREDGALILGATVGNHNSLPESTEVVEAVLDWARGHADRQGLREVRLPFCYIETVKRICTTSAALAQPTKADATMVSPGRSFDSYVRAKLPSSRSWRKEHNRFSKSGATVEQGRLSDFDGAVIDDLLAQTMQKYGSQVGAADLTPLRVAQQNRLDRQSCVFVCRRNSRIIGCSIGFIWRNELFQRVSGFDYPQLADSFEYFNTAYYAPLDAASKLGYDRIHLGTGSLEAKARRGAEIREQFDITFS